MNRATSTPVINHEVNASLYKSRSCLFCSPYKIGSASSANNGRFIFKATLDSTLFSDNHITVSAKTPNNYILYPEPVGPGISNEPQYSSIVFNNFDPVGMSNLLFEFYPKVLLTINMHRTTPIFPQQKHVSLEFMFNDKASVWGLNESASNADTSLTIFTSSNVFTKIISRKFTAANTVVSRIDSVFCSANGANTIDISY